MNERLRQWAWVGLWVAVVVIVLAWLTRSAHHWMEQEHED